MIEHELKVFQIKSALMDLWTENTVAQSYSQWFDLLKPLLCKHFGIKKADFLIYDKARDVYLPLQGHKSTSIRRDAISFEVSTGYPLKSYVQLFREKGFGYANELIVFRDKELKPLVLLLFETTSDWHAFSASSYRIEFDEVISNYIQMIRTTGFLVSREKKFRQLFKVTKLFNATMSSRIILDGIMESITDSFPIFNVELLLSHDQKGLAHSYKLFDYSNERPSAIDAFVSGEVTIENAADLGVVLLNAPIKGKQGNYGVLQLYAPADYFFLVAEQNYISMLANTAGNALENASLFDQSDRLVRDLKLINETSQKLNSNMQIDEMLKFLKKQLVTAFKPSQVAFVFYNEETNYEVSQISTDYFLTVAGEKHINFVSTYLKREEKSFFNANFGDLLEGAIRYESVIAIPIGIQGDHLGFVVCMHENRSYFSFDNFRLMGSLIGHSSLALTNSILRDQLQELADKDHLTKLYARRYLDNIVSRSIKEDEGGVFMLFDIDDFKKVNDTEGHAAGDVVLKQIALHMRDEFKDIGVSARWGGEEFAIYFPLIDEETGVKLARRLIGRIPLLTTPPVTMSAGLYCWKATKKIELKELFNHADSALYSAKSNGKNQLVVHEE